MTSLNPNISPLHILEGRVVKGAGRGKKFGMPTANLALAPGTKLPKLGVYASLVFCDEALYEGVTNVGFQPSVGGLEPVSYTHLDVYKRQG